MENCGEHGAADWQDLTEVLNPLQDKVLQVYKVQGGGGLAKETTARSLQTSSREWEQV